jgi:hypothetical protein
MSRAPLSEEQPRTRVGAESSVEPTARESGTVLFEDETRDAASMIANLQRQLEALSVLVASQQERQ